MNEVTELKCATLPVLRLHPRRTCTTGLAKTIFIQVNSCRYHLLLSSWLDWWMLLLLSEYVTPTYCEYNWERHVTSVTEEFRIVFAASLIFRGHFPCPNELAGNFQCRNNRKAPWNNSVVNITRRGHGVFLADRLMSFITFLAQIKINFRSRCKKWFHFQQLKLQFKVE